MKSNPLQLQNSTLYGIKTFYRAILSKFRKIPERNYFSKYVLHKPVFGVLLAAACLAGCQQQSEPQKKVHIIADRVMTMEYRVVIGQPLTPGRAERVKDIINETFDVVDRVFNNWNSESEISLLNRAPANREFPISKEMQTLLKITDRLVKLSEGYFDPTVGPLCKLWKAKARESELPDPGEIEAIREAIGWDKIILTENGLIKKHPLTSLDLCAIAKGYCVDLIVEGITAAGFPDVYVEWGGEIRAAGRHPEGRPWTIYISRLQDSDPDHAIDYIALKDSAVATSGDYLQSWHKKDGHVYTHIINPKTLLPIEVSSKNICSATVHAKSCVIADALATAATAFPDASQAQVWAGQLQEEEPTLEFWLVTRSDILDKEGGVLD